MSPRGLMAWPPLALLLLWLPDCVPLGGPSKVTGTVGVSLRGTSKVTGTVGGSLIVQCHYGEEFKDDNKMWCKKSLVRCKDIVKTRGSEREVWRGRVSISDHPANLSFTVTMEHLTLEDAGSYKCRVDTPWHEGFDPSFKVEVAVQPDLTPATSGTLTSVTTAKTLTTTSRAQAALSTSLATESATPGPSSQDLHHGQGPGPLVISVLLLHLVLKVLLLLSMLSAVLWVNRPQRSSRSR
ncbi:CMRF-35-like molecule 4 [Urocitellus parryii]